MELKIEDKFITAGGFNTHYLVGGNGPPIVLIHGGVTAAEEAWTYNLPSLTQQYRVYAPDLVGHGKSDKPATDYTLPFFTDFFRQFVEALGLEKFSLMGHSLGGGIALAFTLDHPEKVDKLVLIDSGGIELSITWLGRLLMSFFVLKAQVRKDETYLSLMRNGAKDPQVFGDRLSEIKAPTLIVWAKGDRYLPVRQAYKAHQLIGNSRLHVFERSWHTPHKEHPEEFNHLVLDFLSSTT